MGKKKIFAITIGTVIVIGVLAIGMARITTSKEIMSETEITNVSFDNAELAKVMRDTTLVNQYYTNDLLDTMAEKKNKDYEMKVGEYNSDDELTAAYLPTLVSLKVDYYCNRTLENKEKIGTGNIYDINDEYLYIITCKHIMLCCKEDEQNSVTIRFIDGEIITIPSEYIYLSNDADVSLIVVPIEKISTSTLNTIKTINIDNIYKVTLEEFLNSTIVAYKYSNQKYVKGHLKDLEYKETYLETNNSTLVNGQSGGGLIYKDGTYYGFVVEQHLFKTYQLYYFNDLLIETGEYYDEST